MEIRRDTHGGEETLTGGQREMSVAAANDANDE